MPSLTDRPSSHPLLFHTADKPAPPEGPLEAVEVEADAITLEWKPPKDNGGARVQRYVLEKKAKGSGRWSKCPGIIKVRSAPSPSV